MYTAPDTAGPRARSEHTYTVLKTSLLRGEHLFGVRLAEERLAESIGVSRTPVREALSRLHAEGFLERHPQGGYCPCAPDLDTVRELYEVRVALELDAFDRPGRDGRIHDRDELDSLTADWLALEPPTSDDDVDPSFVLLDEDFHVRLAGASGNRSLVDLLARVNERIRTVRMQDFLTVQRVERTIEQHLGILQLLVAGQVAEARLALAGHFDESIDVVEHRAATALARMLSSRRPAR